MATPQTEKKTPAKKAPPKARADAPDAITLLKNDHREVEGWFEEFEKTSVEKTKAKLAAKICTALKVHTQIEEEIFYPAYLDATGDQELNDEAIVEHDGAKKLIEEIEAGEPGDELWDAKVKVLSEMIEHHVKEEEQPDGMFAKAKKAGLDLDALGAEMAARKEELMATFAPDA
ncbi:MAG: hemerythrin domain-containing protein [Hyphomonadaceae bacterium]